MVWLGCIALFAAPLLHADNIPDLFLHSGTSLNGEWKSIIDPYETGFYDYRHEERDLQKHPSREETFFLDVKPPTPSDRVEYDWDTSPTVPRPRHRAERTAPDVGASRIRPLLQPGSSASDAPTANA